MRPITRSFIVIGIHTSHNVSSNNIILYLGLTHWHFHDWASVDGRIIIYTHYPVTRSQLTRFSRPFIFKRPRYWQRPVRWQLYSAPRSAYMGYYDIWCSTMHYAIIQVIIHNVHHIQVHIMFLIIGLLGTYTGTMYKHTTHVVSPCPR